VYLVSLFMDGISAEINENIEDAGPREFSNDLGHLEENGKPDHLSKYPEETPKELSNAEIRILGNLIEVLGKMNEDRQITDEKDKRFNQHLTRETPLEKRGRYQTMCFNAKTRRPFVCWKPY